MSTQIDEVDPLRVFAMAAAGHRFYWCPEDRRQAMAGVGSVASIALKGRDRYLRTIQRWRRILDGAIFDGPEGREGIGPTLVGGYSFEPEATRSRHSNGQSDRRDGTGRGASRKQAVDDEQEAADLWEGYPAGLFVLPRFLLAHSAGEHWLTYNSIVGPGAPATLRVADTQTLAVVRDDGAEFQPSTTSPGAVLKDTPIPDRTSWMKQVSTTVETISEGRADKVVLARREDFEFESQIDSASVLARLGHDYPHATVFAVAYGTKCFLGASPERLVRNTGGRLQVTCLAGSIERSSDATEDRQNESRLMASTKDREEHEIVVRAVGEALGPISDEISFASVPEITSLPNLHHLCTPVSATLKPGLGVVNAVEALHPTPAMGGFPQRGALSIIRNTEHFDRGWYAAPVGWMDGAGNGEFSVAIRSGLLDGARASLFAGCGIVQDSVPEKEWEETELKMRPMMSALGLI